MWRGAMEGKKEEERTDLRTGHWERKTEEESL
jgi:hypothetical protein